MLYFLTWTMYIKKKKIRKKKVYIIVNNKN